MRRLLTTVASLFAILVASGCGGGVKAADLFIVHRAGGSGAANLTLLVDEEGGVHCNGGPTRRLSDDQIVKARAIQEEIQQQASQHLTLPPRPGSVYSYYLRDESGWVRFADNSTRQPKVFRELQLFVLQTAQNVCGLAQ